MLYLGNLSIDDLENRTGYQFSPKDRSWLEQHKSDNATITYASNKFHIFDVPFCIHISGAIYKEFYNLLLTYEKQHRSKVTVQLVCISETNEEERKRFEYDAYLEKQQDPNSIWNVKWHMLVPISDEIYCRCFINTFTTGLNNVPTIINGNGKIYYDDSGFHGFGILSDPEKDSDAEISEYIILAGFYTKDGRYLDIKIQFEPISFSIKEGIENYISIRGNSYQEISLYR